MVLSVPLGYLIAYIVNFDYFFEFLYELMTNPFTSMAFFFFVEICVFSVIGIIIGVVVSFATQNNELGESIKIGWELGAIISGLITVLNFLSAFFGVLLLISADFVVLPSGIIVNGVVGGIIGGFVVGFTGD